MEATTFIVTKERSKDIAQQPAIDIGDSLTKIAVPERKEDETIIIHCYVFKTANLQKCLTELKEKLINIDNKDCKVVCLTGIGCHVHQHTVEDILGLKVKVFDKNSASLKGTKWLIDWFSPSSFCSPKSKMEFTEFADMKQPETWAKMIEAFEKEMNNGGESFKYPCVVSYCGSDFTVAAINSNGEISDNGRFLLGGKSFLGLSKLLFGTNDYEEIMALASKGNRGNIDTQVKDVMSDDPNSAYGRFPPELALFNFGKFADSELSLKDCKKEDLAHSLVSSLVQDIFYVMSGTAQIYKTPNVYITGNFFSHEVARREVAWVQELFAGGQSAMNVQFVNLQQVAAIGCLLNFE